MYTQIIPIYEAIQQAAKQCNQDTIAISFVKVHEGSSSQNLDQLDSSFMYTQIFKGILLKMEYNQQSIEKFIMYCWNGDYGSLNEIDHFKDEYQSHLTIWW